jgi:N-acetylglucosaminyldiphosphoundecaprenol N-acetyl-beta-D-mannosaminyltransferase
MLADESKRSSEVQVLKNMSQKKRNNDELTTKLAEKYTRVLDVRIDSTPQSGLLRKIAVDIRKNAKFYIVTPNPEQLLLAQGNELYKTILNKASISVPDGVGLVAADRFLKMPNPDSKSLRFFALPLQGIYIGLSIIFRRIWLERDLSVIRGREMFWELVKLANKKGLKMFLLGGESMEGSLTKKQIEKNYKNIKIRTRNGPILNADGNPRSEKDIVEEKNMIEEINTFSPDILMIGMTPPKQEMLMYRWYNKLNFKAAMLVGGTFRYVSGKVKLPPKIVEDFGLEWLWRLMTGSQKWGRIINAVIKFPWAVFSYKLQKEE